MVTAFHTAIARLALVAATLMGLGTLDVSEARARQAEPIIPSGAWMECEAAARVAARETGVPFSVLMAISLTETGRAQAGEARPWPWTVNMQGQGHWFNDRDEARTFAYSHYKTGARSFDVGCFQLNFKWHGQAFSSLEAMFEPLANARYAASFLADLYRETGDWSLAAGTYHSRTPEHAKRYRKTFDTHFARLSKRGVPTRPARQPRPAPTAKQNAFPLLQAGHEAGALGSLVPRSGADRPRLITPSRRAGF